MWILNIQSAEKGSNFISDGCFSNCRTRITCHWVVVGGDGAPLLKCHPMYVNLHLLLINCLNFFFFELQLSLSLILQKGNQKMLNKVKIFFRRVYRVHVQVYMRECMCMHAHMYLFLCVCVCVCVCVCGVSCVAGEHQKIVIWEKFSL